MATLEMQNTVELAESRRKMQARRRMKNRIALTLSMATMAFGLFWLIWILFSTVTRGIDGMSLALFTEMTPPPNTAGGGLANALAGSGLLILWATVFGTPLGIMAGIYLAEYGRKSWIAEVIRFINDILLSAPSIVVGLFVYTIVVAQMEHFSGWAGVIALALRLHLAAGTPQPENRSQCRHDTDQIFCQKGGKIDRPLRRGWRGVDQIKQLIIQIL
jgi:phosphate transport system permease protein